MRPVKTNSEWHKLLKSAHTRSRKKEKKEEKKERKEKKDAEGVKENVKVRANECELREANEKT